MKVGGSVSETRAESRLTPARRRPFWMVGLALVGVILVMLAGALLLDRLLRPAVGLEPAPSLTSADRLTPLPSVATTGTMGVATLGTSQGVPVAGTQASQRVATSPLEQEIEDAYYRYWDVLRQGYLSLDTSNLAEVMSGAELARQEQEIGDLRAQGRAAQLQVDHHLAFVQVSSDEAVIYDEYLNRSVFINQATKQELPTNQPPETEKISFDMRKIDGAWKVIDVVQHN